MADSPHEYIEQLKRERDLTRAENIAFRTVLEDIAALEPTDNVGAIAGCMLARRLARQALGR